MRWCLHFPSLQMLKYIRCLRGKVSWSPDCTYSQKIVWCWNKITKYERESFPKHWALRNSLTWTETTFSSSLLFCQGKHVHIEYISAPLLYSFPWERVGFSKFCVLIGQSKPSPGACLNTDRYDIVVIIWLSIIWMRSLEGCSRYFNIYYIMF